MLVATARDVHLALCAAVKGPSDACGDSEGRSSCSVCCCEGPSDACGDSEGRSSCSVCCCEGAI